MAVVGAGRMGLTHAENLVNRIRGARLVAVTTSSAERAEAVRRCCGDVPVHRTIDRLIESEELDAVIISSSTSAHVENVERCASAGLHILCEKPLALDLEGCDRAASAAQAAGVKRWAVISTAVDQAPVRILGMPLQRAFLNWVGPRRLMALYHSKNVRRSIVATL